MIQKLKKLGFLILASQLESGLVIQVGKHLAKYLKDKSSRIKIYPHQKIIQVIIPDETSGEVIYSIQLVGNSFLIKFEDEFVDKIENNMNVNRIAIDLAYIINIPEDADPFGLEKSYEPNSEPSC